MRKTTTPKQGAAATRRWMIVLITAAVVLSGAAASWWSVRDTMMLHYWRDRLADVQDEEASMLFAEAAQWEPTTVPVLVEALGSPREAVARAAKESLLALLDQWESLDAEARVARLERLARSLADNVPHFNAPAQQDAVDIVRRILTWQFDDQWSDSTPVMIQCGRVLSATRIRSGGGLSTSEDAQSAEGRPNITYPTPAIQSEGDPSLMDMANLPGGALPITDPYGALSSPLFAEEQVEDNSSGSQYPSVGRALGAERFGTPLDRPQRHPPAGTAACSDEDLQAAAGHSSNNAATSPSTSPARPDVSDRSRFPDVDGWQLLRWLVESEPVLAGAARKELLQRGLTDLHFELARRLYHADPAVRLELVETLPSIQSVDARPWLIRLTGDPNTEVRFAAYSILATAGDPALRQHVRSQAQADSDPRIRRLAEQLAAIESRSGQRR